jgi:hypothetical protein
MSSESDGIIDNVDDLPSQEPKNRFVRIFRFFNQCSYYADPRGGIRAGAWNLILGFIFLPLVIICLLSKIEFLAGFSIAIFPAIMLTTILIEFVFFIFGQSKFLLQLNKNWFVMKYPTFSSRSKRFLYAFYFYLIMFGYFTIPLCMYFLLDYFNYYTWFPL